MNTSALQNFASDARRRLMGAVSAKLDAALAPGSSARVDVPAAVERMEQEIKEHGGDKQGRQHVVERYAYRWFNRIIAFRYMDVHGFTAVPVASAVELTDVNGLPGVLVAAKRGEYDEDVFGGSSTMGNAKLRDTVEALFNGSLQSDDPQGQAYGLLLQAECRYWSQFMPFIFERVDSSQGKVDELLMPADLLAEGSVLRQAVITMTPDDCEDVEIIGWLYQFYIAERKTEVMNGFKKSKKAGADEIPAATQLFTPDWIVRYLVQNTVGRLWMQNHPDSQLYKDWEYYIQPENDQESQEEFLHISSPEELTVCDPACGSGHMLTYAFDLLYSIYEEQGYSPSEIPGLILANNLYGMEIDERAANLAAFALTMKARAKARRFFRKEQQVQPHIRLITKERFTPDEVQELNELYKVSLDEDVWNTYANADIVGSLIQPSEQLGQLKKIRWTDVSNDISWDDLSLTSMDLVQRGDSIITQTDCLLKKYAAVVANPPYMGSGNMNSELRGFVEKVYPDSKQDLYGCFVYQAERLVAHYGQIGIIIGETWMFIKKFESMRKHLCFHTNFQSFLHIRDISNHPDIFGANAAFVFSVKEDNLKSVFIKLSASGSEQKRKALISAIANGVNDELYYVVNQHDFAQIPGSPIVYWLPKAVMGVFNRKIAKGVSGEALSDISDVAQGFTTGDNARFLRFWWEISWKAIQFDRISLNEIQKARWVPCDKGGDYRKWYGNAEYVIDWFDNGSSLFEYSGSTPRNRDVTFKPSVACSKITSGQPSFRSHSSGFAYSDAAVCMTDCRTLAELHCYLNSSTALTLMQALSPTLNFEVGQMRSLPINFGCNPSWSDLEHHLVSCAESDWNSYELSWMFSSLHILPENGVMAFTMPFGRQIDVFLKRWATNSEEQRQREIRNNELVADAYGVRDDVPCDVPLERVSLKRNSAFVYPDKTPSERDELFARDVVKEFISYAVGCMFGRYSIDKPGLILASQGETVDDFHERVPNTRFEPDKDNVIPVTEVDCFEDDIVSRFRRFLEVTFGSEHLAENLAYIERTLSKPLRKYFVNDFYKDHVAMYKNRPIYWQYSSRTDNQGTFKALIYLHRYTPATTHTVLEYLRDFTAKIADQADQLERSDRAKDKREAEKLHKAVTECKAYEDNILYPLATRNLEIDLDDGVLVNYLRMGQALRKIDPIEKKRKDVATWTWPVHPLDGDWR